MTTRLRDDYDAPGLRAEARKIKDAGQAPRLLALAAIYDGSSGSSRSAMAPMTRRRSARRRSASPSPRRPMSPIGQRHGADGSRAGWHRAAVKEGRIAFQRIQHYTINSITKKIVTVPFLMAGLTMMGHTIPTPKLMIVRPRTRGLRLGFAAGP
jgi:hypothetical protein